MCLLGPFSVRTLSSPVVGGLSFDLDPLLSHSAHVSANRSTRDPPNSCAFQNPAANRHMQRTPTSESGSNPVLFALTLTDLPRLFWGLCLYLDSRKIAELRQVSKRWCQLCSSDSLWLNVASTLLLRRVMLKSQVSKGVMSHVIDHTLCGLSLCGVYTFSGSQFVQSARLTVRPASMGFRRHVTRVRLEIKFVNFPDVDEVCSGIMRYSLEDKKFRILMRRRGIRGNLINGPRLSVIAAPHRRPWVDETEQHFQSTKGGLRLILTVETPGSWGGVFGVSENDLYMVARLAPELVGDVEQ